MKTSERITHNKMLKRNIRLLRYRNQHMTFVKEGIRDALKGCQNRPERDDKAAKCQGILNGLSDSTGANKKLIKQLKRRKV